VLRSLEEEVATEILFEEASPDISPGLVAAILEPRLEEILSLIKKDVNDSKPMSSLGAGIVLTGGGSRCRGSAQLCDEVFDLPVAKRYQANKLIGAENLAECQWATAIGLSIWAAGSDSSDSDSMENYDHSRGSMFGWMKKIFRKGGAPQKKMLAED